MPSTFRRLSFWSIAALLLALLSLSGCKKEPISSANSGLRPVEEDEDAAPNRADDPPPSGNAHPSGKSHDGSDPPSRADGAGHSAGDGGNGGSTVANNHPNTTGEDFLAPPEGDTGALIAHLDKLNQRLNKLAPLLQDRNLSKETYETLLAQAKPLLHARVATAERILAAGDADADARSIAAEAKIHSLILLSTAFGEDVEDKLHDLALSLADDESPRVRRSGLSLLLSMEVGQFANSPDADPAKLFEYLQALLAIDPAELGADEFQVARAAAALLSQARKDEEAARAIRMIGEAFANSDDAELVQDATDMLNLADQMEFSISFRRLAAGDGGEQVDEELLATAERILARDEVQLETLQLAAQLADELEAEHATTAGKLRQLVAAGMTRMVSGDASSEQLTNLVLNTKLFGEHYAEPLAAAPQLLVAKIEKQTAGETVSLKEFQAALRLAEEGLESNGQVDLAKRIYDVLTPAVAKLDDKQAIEDEQRFLDAAKKRVGLMGKPLVLYGETLDGKAFDWKKYDGKVVLVEFWAATRRSLEAMPDVLQDYARFHESGFEVVGVNMDENAARTQQFLKYQPLPWPNLRNGDPEKPDAPTLADEFGVTYVPFNALLGADGKVIGIQLHGRELDERLSAIFGEDLPDTPSPDEDAPPEPDDPAPAPLP